MKRIKIAEGFTLPADGSLRPIRTKAGMRHVLTRADAAVWFNDPAVRLDLLPASAFTTQCGQPLAEGHRVYEISDRAGTEPASYLVEVIELHSVDRGYPASASLLVEACKREGIDYRPALIFATAERAIYDPLKLRNLLQEHARANRIEAAAQAAENGYPADQVEAIAAGYSDGKADVKELDHLEVLPFGAMAFFYGQVGVSA